MNRRHTADDYQRHDRAAARRAARPGAVVGFHRRPSRRDRGGFRRHAGAGARDRVRAGVQLQILRRGPGTPAASAPGQVPEAEKDQRLYALQALLREQQARFNAGCVGLTLPVLFTGPGRHAGQIAGRSPFLQPVHMAGPAHPDRARNRRCISPPPTPTHSVAQPSLRGESLRLSQIAAPRLIPPGPAARPSPCNSPTTRCCPCCSATTTGIMVRIEQALGVRLSCRGNRVAIAGEPARVDAAQAALQGLWRRLERGESVGRSDVEAAIQLWPTRKPIPACRCPTCRRSAPAAARSARAVGGQAAYMDALARHEMVFGIGPAGTGKTYLAVAQAVAMRRRPRSPASCCGGRRWRSASARIPAGRPLGESRSVSAPLYDALYDMLRPKRSSPDDQRRDRDGTAGVYARPHARAFLRDPGRSAKHHGRADECF